MMIINAAPSLMLAHITLATLPSLCYFRNFASSSLICIFDVVAWNFEQTQL
jgi:hypothetical protein